MKYFILLTGVWLILTSCFPCQDSMDCTNDLSVSQVTERTHPQDSHQLEHCPPFCACACCAIPAFQLVPTFHEHMARMHDARMYPGHPTENLSSYPAGIWQPPQNSIA